MLYRTSSILFKTFGSPLSHTHFSEPVQDGEEEPRGICSVSVRSQRTTNTVPRNTASSDHDDYPYVHPPPCPLSRPLALIPPFTLFHSISQPHALKIKINPRKAPKQRHAQQRKDQDDTAMLWRTGRGTRCVNAPITTICF